MKGTKSKDAQRDYDQFTDRVYRPYALAIGQFCLAWNDLHERLGIIFVLLCATRRKTSFRIKRVTRNTVTVLHDQANSMSVHAAIWHSAHYDRPKRDMLMALLEHISSDLIPQKLLDDIRWLTTEIGKLEELRNNAVHTPFLWGPPFSGEQPGGRTRVRPNLFLGNSRAKKLSQLSFKKKIIDQLQWGYAAVLILRDFAVQIESVLASDCKGTLPDRPQLPNRGEGQAAKYPPQATPPRQRRSSLG